MFDRMKLNDNLKDKYDEMFKQYCKSEKKYGYRYDREIIEYVILLINSINTLNDFILLEDEFYKITDALPRVEQSSLYSVFKSIINVIRRRFHQNKREFLLTKTEDSIFDILTHTRLEKLKQNYTLLKSDSIFNTLLSNDEITNDLAILFTLNILTKSNNEEFINMIYDIILKENDPYIKDILYIMLSSKIDFNSKQEEKITLILNTLNDKNNNIDKLIFRRFINFLFTDKDKELEIYNYNLETIELILKNISSKNSELLFSIISNPAFNDIENNELKKDIVSTIIKINIIDEDYRDKVYKIIINIISINKDIEYANYLLNKLTYIKSNKSLDILLKLHPFMEMYSTKDSKKELINTLSRDDKPKKLEIILRDK